MMMDGQTPTDCSTIGGQVQGGRSHGREQQQLRVQPRRPDDESQGRRRRQRCHHPHRHDSIVVDDHPLQLPLRPTAATSYKKTDTILYIRSYKADTTLCIRLWPLFPLPKIERLQDSNWQGRKKHILKCRMMSKSGTTWNDQVVA
jgi:hypothetical protein